ncbi:hypothetical protein EVAR_74205_1 [Eumeta japonica]|uniref:Uncharacterized protein n=1 Tax=Eumeta variegata TaxID=151549 RepID=A0A4C1SFA0_EUMVA|nr:hypothetical protein EVAR_74205_1 [Eumeta japonica]
MNSNIDQYNKGIRSISTQTKLYAESLLYSCCIRSRPVCTALTLSTGMEGHARHKFQNEPIIWEPLSGSESLLAQFWTVTPATRSLAR